MMEHITWLASYPKSGNTWVRMLLEAYRQGGYVDINDIRTGMSDSALGHIRAVSPVPMEDMTPRATALLRPAALIHMMVNLRNPRFVKTHFANVTAPRLTPFIPFDLTERAVYIVRDPRSVVISFAQYFGMDHARAVDAMANDSFTIESDNQADSLVTDWSTHVKSWTGETQFKVLTIRYEDLLEDAIGRLAEILEFCNVPIIAHRIERAVAACDIARVMAAEEKFGFLDMQMAGGKGERFFNGGGTRWREELDHALAKRIESDHLEQMTAMGYLQP